MKTYPNMQSWCVSSRCLECRRDVCDCPASIRSADVVNHPPHYTHSTIEPIDVIEDWGLGFHLGNALKYIARADHKGTKSLDLKKAVWYLERELERSEADEQGLQV